MRCRWSGDREARAAGASAQGVANVSGSSPDRLLLVSSVASALVTAVTMARSKVTASMLGPEGLGLFAEITQVVALVMIPVSFAAGPSLTLALSKPGEEGPRALRSARQFTLVLGLAAALIAVGVGVATFGPPSAVHFRWLILASLAAVGGSLVGVENTVLVARARLGASGALNIVQGLLLGTMSIVGTFVLGLDGQFAAAGLAAMALVPIARTVTARMAPDLGPTAAGPLDWGFFRAAVLVGAAGLFAALTSQAMWSLFRWLIHQGGGAAANGQLQAARAVGVAYFALVLQSMGNVIFPSYSAARNSEDLRQSMRRAMALVLRYAPPVILVAIAVRRPLMHALYSADFDEAAHAVGYQMAADLAKGVAWAMGGTLLYRGKVRGFVVAEAAATVALTIAGVILAQRLGVKGIALAHLVGYTLSLFTNAWVVRRSLDLPVEWAVLTQASIGSLMLGAVAWAADHDHRLEWLALGVGVVWGLAVARTMARDLGLWEKILRKLGRAPGVK